MSNGQQAPDMQWGTPDFVRGFTSMAHQLRRSLTEEARRELLECIESDDPETDSALRIKWRIILRESFRDENGKVTVPTVRD